ncbi:peptidase M17 [Rhizosphaericola mali]|uniref:Peptidase M17 n=2 Tax=Rhizosphaericola mali TaxID=2545455 RepID=A0A5P2G6R1_9BACT|nr:peptidase M17 [Rhizosphaericola mali]
MTSLSKLWKKATIISGFLIAGIAPIQQQIFAQSTGINQIDPKQKLTPAGTSKNWGNVDGVSMIGLVQGPSATVTDLQVVCAFEYTEGDIFNAPPALPAEFNGLVHLDKAMNGKFTELRKSGRFVGRRYETILIDAPKGSSLKAKKYLIIGLGDRNQFNAGIMTDIGEVAAREAVKLGVTNFAFGSDLKDAGIDSPTAEVAGNIVKGIVKGYRTEEYLKDNNLAKLKPLKTVYLLAGPAFFTVAGNGIQSAIASINN